MKNEDRKAIIGWIITIPFVIVLALEGVVLYNLYMQADKVECNLLWCVFTTEGRVTEITTNITQTCYINGEETPCGFSLNTSKIINKIGEVN